MALLSLLACLACCSHALADYTVQSCGSNPNFFVFGGSSNNSHIHTQAKCPASAYNGSGLAVFNAGNASAGQRGYVQTNAPAGLELVGASAGQISSTGINDNLGWGGGFYWAGGGIETTDQTDQNPNIGMTFTAPSSYWGLQMICGSATCNRDGMLAVQSVDLYVRETQGPTFNASGLWQTSGWVRGSWPSTASADSPSGVCNLSSTLNGLNIASSASSVHLSYAYKQCATPSISQTVDTSRYGDGVERLVLAASDAANVPASASKTVYIDNRAPTVTMSGPTDAPSTAGTQYLTAAAMAGPSGVAGIACSLDGGPPQWYATSTAQIPVTGIGTHQVQCTAENNAVDSRGVRGTSAPATYSIRIGTPTVAVVAFSKVVDKLRCRRVSERVRIPARWVKVRLHGRVVRVRERAHTQTIRVTRCHAHTVKRRVTRVVAVRHGSKTVHVKRTEMVRVVVEPHTVLKSSRRVSHGQAATVDGWLGTTTGTALAGQPVDVLTAPDNGSENFRVAATVTTAANGGWSARLPAGPSRLIEATYPGAASTEPAVSGPAHLIVPAEVKLLNITPRRVAWGGTIHLTGQLKGGYLPRGGALVRLRIGEGAAQTTYGVRTHVGGNGRFTTAYTFGEGVSSVHRSYWFQLASLPTGNYPYAPAASRRLSVNVGGHPRPRRRRHHRGKEH